MRGVSFSAEVVDGVLQTLLQNNASNISEITPPCNPEGRRAFQFVIEGNDPTCDLVRNLREYGVIHFTAKEAVSP